MSETWKLSNVTGTFTRFVVTRDHLPDDIDHVQQLQDLKVKAGGQDKKTEISSNGDVTSIAVADVSGATQLDFTYTVKGAVAETLNGTEVRFAPLTGINLTVQQANIVFSTPEVSHVSCFAGAVDSNTPCSLAQMGETAGPTFQQQGLPPGNTVRMTVGFPEGEIAANSIVEYRKTFKRAFSTDTAQLLTALGGPAARRDRAAGALPGPRPRPGRPATRRTGVAVQPRHGHPDRLHPAVRPAPR